MKTLRARIGGATQPIPTTEALVDLSKIAALAALPKELLSALERLPQLERRVTELEKALAGPLCPKCNLPGWHEASNEVTKGLGANFGLRDITYACLRCGYRKTVPPE